MLSIFVESLKDIYPEQFKNTFQLNWTNIGEAIITTTIPDIKNETILIYSLVLYPNYCYTPHLMMIFVANHYIN